jgi:hypothetical protein
VSKTADAECLIVIPAKAGIQKPPAPLPESVDDYVGPENPVQFIEAFVDGLDQ